MNNAELQAFIQDELKKARTRTFPMADFVRLQSIYGTPRPIVLDAQGNEVSREYGHEWSSEYMGTFDNAPLMPTLTIEGLKSAERAMKETLVGVAGAEVQPGDKLTFAVGGTFLPWPAPPPTPPYRSLDADGRTRTAEWQESVRQRFERRVGAALTSTTQRT